MLASTGLIMMSLDLVLGCPYKDRFIILVLALILRVWFLVLSVESLDVSVDVDDAG